MSGYDPNAKKSFAEIREGIDRTIMLHCWAHITVCPVCGCESDIQFGNQTSDPEKFVEIEDCELCDAVLQEIAGHVDPVDWL